MGARAVIRLLFDRPGVDGSMVFGAPELRVKEAPASNGARRTTPGRHRPVQQPVHRDNKECEWPTE